MSEQNKTVMRRMFDEAWNEGNLDVIDEFVAEDAVEHDTQNPFASERGPEGVKRLISTYRAAFSDLRFDVEEMVAEGDIVVIRWTATGTNDGELLGAPATGKVSTVSGMGMDRFEDGKVAESWTSWDTLGMMQQLGMVPEPQPAA